MKTLNYEDLNDVVGARRNNEERDPSINKPVTQLPIWNLPSFALGGWGQPGGGWPVGGDGFR